MRPADANTGSRVVSAAQISAAVLAWYDRHARQLPWRIGPKERAAGVHPDPYGVWLSEVMLQQTTVAAVRPYFERFISQWPTVAELAAAPDDDVMRAWACLGYYSRARNLITAAREIVTRGGCLPDNADELKRLPGVGAYTAAAIAAIAFDRAEPVVDGNVERVLARLFGIADSGSGLKAAVRQHQMELTPDERAGDYAQALMDLGAMICTPKQPTCAVCPLQADCAVAGADAESFPTKTVKVKRPTRYGNAFVATRADGAVLLRQRPPKGLLGGMAEVPGSAWSSDGASAEAGAPLSLDWRRSQKDVTHVFTHFRLELDVYHGEADAEALAPDDCWWSPADELAAEALPSVMRKTIEVVRPGATMRPPSSPGE